MVWGVEELFFFFKRVFSNVFANSLPFERQHQKETPADDWKPGQALLESKINSTSLKSRHCHNLQTANHHIKKKIRKLKNTDIANVLKMTNYCMKRFK